MSDKLNGYDLSRAWFDFCFENPEKITPTHTALYFFIIEHCNRLGWKEKFGLPMQMAKDAIGISNYRTYSKVFNDLVEWEFIIMVQKSTNQYSSNIIAIAKNTKAKSKALDIAMQKHSQKQSQKQVHGTVCINKHINIEPINLIIEEEPESNFELTIESKKIKNLKAYVQQTFPKMEETLKMKVTSKNYLERQEDFILRNNEGSYTTEKDFRNHYTNFILKKVPLEKEKYSGQKEKPNKVELTLNNHNEVINRIRAAAAV